MRECLREELLQSYLDGELSSDAVENVASHLATCRACAANASELERQNNLVAAALAPEFEASVPTVQLRQRIDAAIADGQFVNTGAVEKAGLANVRGWFQSLSDLFTFTPQRAFGYASLVAVLAFAAIFAITQRDNFKTTTGSGEVATVNQRADSPGVPNNPPDTSTPADVATRPSEIVAANSTGVRTPRPQRQRSTYAAAPSRRTAESNHVKLLPGERSYLQTIAELDSTMKVDKGRMRPAMQAEFERNLAFVDRALVTARIAAKNNPNNPDAAEFMFAAYQSKLDLLNTVADARVSNRQH